jgi:TRAP-type uncharacterized transport system fused permease subunit
MFVNSQELMLQGTVVNIVIAILTASIGIWALTLSIEGYFNRKVLWFDRILLFVGALCLMYPEHLTDAVGLCFVAFVFVRYNNWKRQKKAAAKQATIIENTSSN